MTAIRRAVFGGVLGVSALTLIAGTAHAADDLSRAYAAELLADSAARTNALDADGAPVVKITGNMQFRYYVSSANDRPPAATSEDVANGFQLRRARVIAAGQLGAAPDISYKVEGDFSRSTGAATLLDGYGEFKLGDGWTLRAGQFKIPMLREELTSHTAQLAVERSVITQVFTMEYSQGVQATHVGESLRTAVSFNDGARALNTDFDNGAAAPGGEADFAFTGRLDYRIEGDWKQFDQFTSWRESAFGARVGGALHYQDGGETFGDATGRTSDRGIFQYTIDGAIVGDGWNAFAAFVGRHTEDDASTPSRTLDDFGFVVQGGVFLTDQLEGFARYAVVIPDTDYASDKEFHEITAGVNYYITPRSHAAKFSADVLVAPGRQSRSSSLVSATTASGLAAADDSQYTLRVQMQLMF